VVFACDILFGSEISFSLFYLARVCIATWYASGLSGLGTAMLCAGMWLLADKASGYRYSHAFIPYWNAFVRFVFFIIVSHLLAQMKKKLLSEEEFADVDQLTSVFNTRGFYERAEAEVARCRRYARPFSISYIDLDNFKKVNDEHDHETGDRLLQTVAGAMKENTRKTDIVARLGGDEFAVLMPETGYETSAEAVDKIKAILVSKMKKDEWPVTFSIGTVTFETALPMCVRW